MTHDTWGFMVIPILNVDNGQGEKVKAQRPPCVTREIAMTRACNIGPVDSAYLTLVNWYGTPRIAKFECFFVSLLDAAETSKVI